MPIPIRFVEHPPLTELSAESKWYDGVVDFAKLEIGDLCYYHYKGEPCRDPARLSQLPLTQYYFQQNAHRPPLILAIPDKPSGKIYFLVDGQFYSGQCLTCGKSRMSKCTCGHENYKPKGYYDGWIVSGTPPFISVQPSINYD